MSGTEGQLLAGKYRVERVLGQGGMGVVVAAHHLVLDEVVAIKFLLPEALESSEAVARFEREARAAVKIKSEHVARVTDVGRLETGAPYMVMELLRGRDLGVLLREEGPLSLTDVADYLLQAGEAIAEAHGLGIVHRDLKPPNLFLTHRADGSSCVKVLDFGISKLTNARGGGDQVMTSTLAVMGSPLYMSPEQLMSARNVDLRTDIWALGVICFELLTGKLPFDGETLPQLCMSINLSPPKPVRAYRPDLPLEVEQMILRCLSKDPAQRFANVAALATELVKYAPRHAQLSAERIERLARSAGFPPAAPAARPPSGGGAALAETPSGSLTLTEFSNTRRSSSGALRWGAGLAMLLGAGGVAAFVWSRSTSLPMQGKPPIEALPPPVSASAPPAVLSVTPTPAPAVTQPAEEPDSAPLAEPVAATRPSPPAAVVRPRAVPGAGRRPAATPPAAIEHPPPADSAPAATDCSIPYFYDARGNKVFKKGCL